MAGCYFKLCMYVYTYIYVCMCICVYVYVSVCASVCVCVCVCVLYTSAIKLAHMYVQKGDLINCILLHTYNQLTCTKFLEI